MGALKDSGVEWVHHYAPVHYLPFIARAQKLMCKPSLKNAGFPKSHLRSKSSSSDVARGFGEYAFLTLDPKPRILSAKLSAGFPHLAIAVPVNAIESSEYRLCRYNVAMTRYLRRDGKSGHEESESNGRYYCRHQIPIAKSEAEKRSLLEKHLHKTMIEVLICGDLPLPDTTEVRCFSEPDLLLVKKVLRASGAAWKHEEISPPENYPRNASYAKSVEQFIDEALENPSWRGNGLEFDRV